MQLPTIASPNTGESLPIRRYILRFFGILVVFFILISLWQFFHMGAVKIEASGVNNNISLSKLSNKKDILNKKPIKQAQDELKFRVATGTYLVEIQSNRSTLISKVVTVTAHKTFEYSFKAASAASTEPVISIQTGALAADNDQLEYLDTTNNKITRISRQNAIPSIVNDRTFSSVSWVDTNYGIGQGSDGQLYEINSDTITKIDLPATGLVARQMTYAVASDRRLYVSIGQDIYTGFVSSGLKKIYTTTYESPYLAASTDTVAIVNQPTHGDGDETKPFIETVSNSGQQLAKKSLEANQVSWSPDGSKLVAINYTGLSYIYDKELNRLSQIGGQSILSAAWSSTNIVLYSIKDTLWSFNNDENTSTALAQVPQGQITDLKLNTDKDYIYMITHSADDSNEGAGISRFGLRGQVVDKQTAQLPIFLPLQVIPCSADYSNFAQPTIILYPYNDGGADDCQTAITATLQQDLLDTSKLQFVTGPVISQSDD